MSNPERKTERKVCENNPSALMKELPSHKNNPLKTQFLQDCESMLKLH